LKSGPLRIKCAAMLILASSSPRRRDLLAGYGYDFVICPAAIEEVAPDDMNVGDITLHNARLKAEAVAKVAAETYPSGVVVGVDTLVALDGKSIGKPRDLDEAFRMLSTLSGRIHEVYSGVWLIPLAGGQPRAFVEVSRVKFKPLNAAAIRAYMARINPLDKAGAYAAQDDHPDGVVESIEGSRTNVIGLPMEALGKTLAKMGITPRQG